MGAAAAEPPKAHVHGLQYLADHDVVGNADSGQVVALDWCLELGPAHFNQCLAQGNHGLGADVEHAKLGLSCVGHDELDYSREGDGGAIA